MKCSFLRDTDGNLMTMENSMKTRQESEMSPLKEIGSGHPGGAHFALPFLGGFVFLAMVATGCGSDSCNDDSGALCPLDSGFAGAGGRVSTGGSISSSGSGGASAAGGSSSTAATVSCCLDSSTSTCFCVAGQSCESGEMEVTSCPSAWTCCRLQDDKGFCLCWNLSCSHTEHAGLGSASTVASCSTASATGSTSSNGGSGGSKTAPISTVNCSSFSYRGCSMTGSATFSSNCIQAGCHFSLDSCTSSGGLDTSTRCDCNCY
jgi:hypothetical protein